MDTTSQERISGADLRAVREASGLGRTPVARAFGASRSRIENIEALSGVLPRVARRYVEAVAAAAGLDQTSS